MDVIISWVRDVQIFSYAQVVTVCNMDVITKILFYVILNTMDKQ